MGQTKIRTFKGLRDGKEDPNEFLEDIDWAYDQDYKSKEPKATGDTMADALAVEAYHSKTQRILFRQHISDSAWDWYTDLDSENKNDWLRLRKLFLPAFEVTVKDSQTKKFELRVKLHNLEQLESENIAEYLKKASELAMKLPTDDIDVGMATLKGMSDIQKRERVSFECNKDHDYSFTTVQRLIKAAYGEVGKLTPFDPGYKDSMKITLPGIPAASNNDELLRQVLINTQQALPALLQGLRNLGTNPTRAAPRPAAQQSGQEYPKRLTQSNYLKDLSEVKCFACNQYGHYANKCPHTPPEITAGVVTHDQTPDLHDQEENDELWRQHAATPARCLIPNDTLQAMAATRKGQEAKTPQILKKAAGVKKTGKSTPYNPPTLPKHILDQITEHNKAQSGGQENAVEEVDEMDEDEDADIVSETVGRASQSREPLIAAQGNRGPPQTRVTKTGKVQELVSMKAPKLPDAIRGMANRQRFDISSILNLPVNISLGELLDRSDSTIKELAFNMQRATPRYRVRKTTGTNTIAAPSGAVMSAAALHPPPVTAQAFDDDGESKPVMITSWVHSLKLPRTLLDGGSLVELISEKKVNSMRPRPQIHTDGYLRVSLATDKLDTLTNYVLVPVNVEGVEATIKAWVVQVDIYDLLLGLTWMRRVHCNPHYGIGKITIAGDDRQTREVPGQLMAMETGLPTVEFEDEGYDSADQACQQLLDEQENAMP